MGRSVKGHKSPDARRARWDAHRAERRRQFVDAALRVVERDGPELVMDAVAAEAGVTKPVLYRYFSDKADLVQALAERGTEILRDRLVPAINADSPILARIRDAVGAYFAVIDEHPNLYWLLARQGHAEYSSGPTPGAGPVHENKEFLAAILTALISDYLWVFGLDAGPAEPWAYGLTGLMQSTGEWWLQRRSMSREHVAAYVTQLIWAAISGTLRDSGVPVDPDKPLPPLRPALTLRRNAAAGPAAAQPAQPAQAPDADATEREAR
jgi:AcrR family transcriptional regulator